MYAEYFRAKLKKERENAGYTQKQVADAIGVGTNTICRIENGTREPNLETIGLLIEFYQKSADYFFGTGATK